MTCIKTWGGYDPVSNLGEFVVECEDGKRFTIGHRLVWPLFGGYIGVLGGREDGNAICDPRIISYIAGIAARCEHPKIGDCHLADQETAMRICRELGVPLEPVGDSEKVANEKRWLKKWREDKVLCQMDDGKWVIEDDVEPAFRNHIVIHDAKHEDQSAHSPAKKKRSKTKKPVLHKWPKNKAEHRKNQMMLWGGEGNLAQYETRKLKTPDGKRLTYYVKVDPSGRIRILDTGEDAPYGYYSQSSRYYVLKRNARIAKLYSSMAQRALWYACNERFKGPTGLVVRLGNRGLIRKISGKYAEMNLGRSVKGRKLLDSDETYSPCYYSKAKYIVVGHTRLKPSKYTMIIEQAKIKPDSREACDWFGDVTCLDR